MSIQPNEPVTYAEALCLAQSDAMEEDSTITLLGQDIQAGFPFGATSGLVDRVGVERVRNTPISEAATMGCGVGLAMMGVRSVVEVDFSGFLLLGMDQLVNNAARIRYMSGGQIHVPLVVRVGQGPLGGFAAQHSQTQHAFLASVPGLTGVTPSSPQEAYEAMRWALKQSDPVVVLEDMRLYRLKGEIDKARSSYGAVPSAHIQRRGTDLTILTYGYGVGLAIAASETLSREGGPDAEVIDLRALSPLDVPTIVESVRKTGRVICLGDDAPMYGVTATLAALVEAEAGDALLSGTLQVGSRFVPTPYSPPLEALVYPTEETVLRAVRTLAGEVFARA